MNVKRAVAGDSVKQSREATPFIQRKKSVKILTLFFYVLSKTVLLRTSSVCAAIQILS